MKGDKERIRYRPYDRSSRRERSRSNDSVNNGQQSITKIMITPVSMPFDVVDLDNPNTKPGSIPLSDLIDGVSAINARLTLNLSTDSRNELTDYKYRLMAEIDKIFKVSLDVDQKIRKLFENLQQNLEEQIKTFMANIETKMAEEQNDRDELISFFSSSATLSNRGGASSAPGGAFSTPGGSSSVPGGASSAI